MAAKKKTFKSIQNVVMLWHNSVFPSFRLSSVSEVVSAQPSNSASTEDDEGGFTSLPPLSTTSSGNGSAGSSFIRKNVVTGLNNNNFKEDLQLHYSHPRRHSLAEPKQEVVTVVTTPKSRPVTAMGAPMNHEQKGEQRLNMKSLQQKVKRIYI